MEKGPALRLFQGLGVEAEYMIVDRESLAVRPIADILLRDARGEIVNELEDGEIAYSNELVKHLVELKTNGPAGDGAGLDALFAKGVEAMNERMAPRGAMLLPTAMHPFMDPKEETKLWDHGDLEIYETYHRIFDCRRHGWANLQSLHLNLPFGSDAEFGALHAAVRVALPLIPALAASSPVMEGRLTGSMDTRLEVYRDNQKKVPSIAGKVIPEDVFTQAGYRAKILEPMYRDMASLDPDEIIRDEWLNSRGAIARFDRNTIEIRLIDTQECPAMDNAVAWAVVYLVRGLVEGFFSPPAALRKFPTDLLAEVLWSAARKGGETVISGREYQGLFGLDGSARSGAKVWRLLAGSLAERYPEFRAVLPRLEMLTGHGTLAERIVRGIGEKGGRDDIARVYRELAGCLAHNVPYMP
ncbi:MAG TPA: glutamate-cysteine ligase family protein [Spirochaetota bacterium]|nr:glutamate-cysteine ligase family protein [Spirochaetota bacterium]